ncbi:MAG: hypothetical protein ABIJ56_19380 [Pseudomonadota bacterium]
MRKSNITPWAVTIAAAAIMPLWGCGPKAAEVPQVQEKPFKEISAIEMFEKVIHEKGYTTTRKKPIYVLGYGELLIDLAIDDKLSLAIEYLTEEDRAKLGGKFQSSKVGDKFKLLAVATQELKENEELTQANSTFAVVFDDRDYVYQPNPTSETRAEFTLEEIERRIKKDIVDVVSELEKVLATDTGGGE